jgi:hypothetical protein
LSHAHSRLNSWWKKKAEQVEDKGIDEDNISLDKNDAMEKDDFQDPESADEDAPVFSEEPDPNKTYNRSLQSSEFLA